MVMSILRVSVLGAVLALCSCEDLGDGAPGEDGWAIYLLSDPALTSYQVREIPLADLRLAPSALISVRDILRYDWEAHEIEFTPAMEDILDTMAVRGGSLQGVPFIVVVGRDRIYLGAFWWSYSSMLPCCPYIEAFSVKPRKIQLDGFHQGPDPRMDVRIYRALKSAGVLYLEHPMIVP